MARSLSRYGIPFPTAELTPGALVLILPDGKSQKPKHKFAVEARPVIVGAHADAGPIGPGLQRWDLWMRPVAVWLVLIYRPPTVISPTTSVGAAIDPRNSRSDPTASRFISICCRVPAMVTSETGNASSPLRIHRPTAPRE